jgi:hypothetical protein
MHACPPAACRFANDQDVGWLVCTSYHWLQSWDPYRIPVGGGGQGLILGLRAWRLVPKGGIFYALTATVPWTDDRIRFDAALLMEYSSGRLRPPGAAIMACMARWPWPVAPPLLANYTQQSSSRPSFPVFPPWLIYPPLPAALLFCFF